MKRFLFFFGLFLVSGVGWYFYQSIRNSKSLERHSVASTRQDDVASASADTTSSVELANSDQTTPGELTHAIRFTNQQWIAELEQETSVKNKAFDVAVRAYSFTLSCAGGDFKKARNSEELVKYLVSRKLVSDTSEVRTSLAFVRQIELDACEQMGVERARSIHARLSVLHRSMQAIVSDMIFGLPERTNTSKPNVQVAIQIIQNHDSLTAVERALQSLTTEPEALSQHPFFAAGAAIPSTYERAQLLSQVGVLLRCEQAPADCAPQSWHTIGYCSLIFSCGPGRDLRSIMASRLSLPEMNAVKAMTAALLQLRRESHKKKA